MKLTKLWRNKMSRGVNKVILIGNLGKDPETRVTPEGTSITKFSIATSESWKDKKTGQLVENTEWHNITTFGRLAEIVNQYVKKGAKVYIEGKLKTDKWKDKESGKDVYKTGIVANELQILSSKDKLEENTNNNVQWANNNTSNLSSEIKDDDIPF
jgi:single-strand DNA-binding protein